MSKLSYLKSKNTPSDSIIKWVNELLPLLEENREYEDYFELKGLKIRTYAKRGDIGLALEVTRRMSEEARDMHNIIGTAEASKAIGDTYLLSGMALDAMLSYEEAFDIYRGFKNGASKQLGILYQMLRIQLYLNNEDEAYHILKRMDEFASEKSNYARLVDSIYYGFYHINKNHPDSAYFYLNKVEKDPSLKTDPTIHYRFLDIKSRYLVMRKDYTGALECLNEALSERNINPGFFERRNGFLERADIYESMGEVDKAVACYKELMQETDSIHNLSYGRQINLMRTTFQVDNIELETKIQRNKNLQLLIFSVLILISIVLLFSLFLRRNSKKLMAKRKEQILMKQKVERSIQAKSAFLSNMSHEIRTPLNAIVGFSSLLISEDIDNETRLQCNENIQLNSDLLIHLINDVVDLSRLDVGEMPFHIESCDAISLCDHVINTVSNIKQTEAKIILGTDLTTLSLETDRTRLQQMLINLLVNATKFTPEGKITLSVRKQSDDLVEFAVTDTGCGIPENRRKELFQRFGKLHEHTTGFGLGLSICQLIITRLGGKIWIDPEYHSGARFVFVHPVKQNQQV